MLHFKRVLKGFATLCAAFLLTHAIAAQGETASPVNATPTAIVLDVKGVIGPAIQDFIERGLARAHADNATIVILQLDTPGGLDSSMRGIIKAILASPIPVATFVSPNGARAASAGTYILYASHLAVMAPGTNLGAATPVQLGMPGTPPSASTDEQQPAKASEDNHAEAATQNTLSPKTAMESKALNDAAAYIQSLAMLRGRNVDWAEKAVREAASLSAPEALAQKVIDFISIDVRGLLKKADGRQVSVGKQPVTLHTQNATIQTIKPDWRMTFLTTITNPNIAYILFLIGIYGIIFELANPGLILPGVAGAICLLVAAYAFQLLPIDYTGLGLIIAGVAFMVAEAFVPSFGALGIGGVIAFIAGSMMLIDTSVPGYSLHLPLIITVGGVTALFFVLVINMALKARFRKVVSGEEALIGATGRISKDKRGNMTLLIEGETWHAQPEKGTLISIGDTATVIKRQGLTLIVRSDNHDDA